MTIQGLLATMTVADLEQAVEWYTAVLDGEPDARPMDGLAEWHLTPSFGVQVWADAGRAGGSGVVLDHTDLDALAARLDRAGVPRGGVRDVTASRLLPRTDPDGNQVVFTGR